jgi:uncharacterized protein
MLRIIRFSELQETPWRNGGGVTREIAIEGARDDFVWRLSMADVGVDGPFSKFDGMQRILTVIQGCGMELISSPIKLQANLYVPVRFDGSCEIEAKLIDGPLRDLNLIYRPERCIAEIQLITESYNLEASHDRTYGIHCIEGVIVVNDAEQLHPGDSALVEYGAVVVAGTATALLITLDVFGDSTLRGV